MPTNVAINDSIIFLPKYGYGGHFAHCVVIKVNKATFECIETPTSYNPGKRWNIHKNCEFKLNGKWCNS